MAKAKLTSPASSQTRKRTNGAARTALGGRQYRHGKQPRYATSAEILWMAGIGMIAGLLLLATMVALFPAAVASTTPRAPAQRVPLFFGAFDVTLRPSRPMWDETGSRPPGRAGTSSGSSSARHLQLSSTSWCGLAS